MHSIGLECTLEPAFVSDVRTAYNKFCCHANSPFLIEMNVYALESNVFRSLIVSRFAIFPNNRSQFGSVRMRIVGAERGKSRRYSYVPGVGNSRVVAAERVLRACGEEECLCFSASRRRLTNHCKLCSPVRTAIDLRCELFQSYDDGSQRRCPYGIWHYGRFNARHPRRLECVAQTCACTECVRGKHHRAVPS